MKDSLIGMDVARRFWTLINQCDEEISEQFREKIHFQLQRGYLKERLKAREILCATPLAEAEVERLKGKEDASMATARMLLTYLRGLS